ncbi:hypothetical protein Poli38472_006854 [Pythium oligandrum]|uniref:VWFA domain-containing protein n=1 Tax=Pythium oligandrum TaxID=41045 RepID=A0A8K1C5B8_PYTOL|nr:hypothetical protein Poli38472_006854 [Pythium oligandrum]|eukprot:TMW56844.1 hypothetical protein Poli38472_006854 [Pythium oligandrum]
MSRTKEATVVLLDAGASMCTPLRERHDVKFKEHKALTTRFDAAVAAVESLYQQKLFFKPKDEVGVVLFGTEETSNQLNEDQGEDEYTNVTVLSDIDTPTLSVCEKLQTITPTADPAVKVDLLNGLIVALDLLFRRTEGKKYEKRLLVLTDAASKIEDASDIESVVEMIKNMDVKLQVVGIDFNFTTDKEVDPNAMKDEPMDQPKQEPGDGVVSVKEENEKMLVSIAKEVHGEVASASKRMQLLAQGMKKTVGQVTKFRGPLEIGDFGIPLYCFLKTKTATLPTLAKESQVSHEKEESGKVRMDRRYTSPQNPDEEVPPEQQVKAYRYGMERVPFSSADVEFFKFQTEKSLKLLGFVAQDQLSHAKLIGGTDIFIAEPNKPNAALALAALVEGMVELGHVAVARFVARKNAAPKIIALIPHAPTPADNYYCLWGQQLPYEEDVRTYEFAPLKTKKHTPTEQQQDLADKLVERLSVREDKAREAGASFNPVLRRFFHAVEQRALDENAGIPPVPSYLESSLKMDEARQARIQDIIQGFGDAFQLKEAVKKQSERKKKSFWSDVGASAVKDEPVDDDGDQQGGGGDDDGGSEIDLDELLDGGDVTTVGSMNPIADFETLVDFGKNNKQRLVTAVTGMQTQITNFFQGGVSFYAKAVQCLAHFRKRSVEIHYASEFNDFFTQLKSTLGDESPGWKAIQKEGITLLTDQDDPTLSVTTTQSRAFLYGEEEVVLQVASATLSSQVEEMENEDDMFADFE